MNERHRIARELDFFYKYSELVEEALNHFLTPEVAFEKLYKKAKDEQPDLCRYLESIEEVETFFAANVEMLEELQQENDADIETMEELLNEVA